MTLEQRVDRLEASWGKNDVLVRKLRSAVTVTADLQYRHGKVLKEHEEWLVEHRAAIAEHKAAMKQLDERIASLVSAIGDLIRKQ